MKLCVITDCYGGKSLDEALSIFAGLGIDAAEIGCGRYPGKAHCDPEILLNSEYEYNKFMATFKKYGIEPQLVTHEQRLLDMKVMEAAFKSAELSQVIKF